jgi:hypothetical protein
VPGEERARVIRYETIIVALIGLSALFVSGYTAYVQRQQVRAMVWPILEYDTSNEPMIRLTLENKGVGPAIIRHVIVTVDGQPVPNWNEALQKLAGPGTYHFSESTMSGHVLKAGESMDIVTPHDSDNSVLTFEKAGELWTTLNKARSRVGVEICYCSTLGDCWILRSDSTTNSTVETKKVPVKSATTFQR